MKEVAIMHRIRLAASRFGARLLRNNVGVLRDRGGRYVHYGLCAGSSDLIGWMPVTITPNMVGSRIAVFLAVEVKAARGRVTPEQEDFLRAVNQAGGVAFVAHSEEEAISQLQQ